MDRKKSQHFNFSHEAIPVLFHNNAENFFKYLEKDGIKFLKFYWKHLETNLKVDILSPTAGLNFQTELINEKIRVAIITMPEPKEIGEVFYLALVKLPQKFSLFKVPFTKSVSLEYEGKAEDGSPITGIYEITPRARNIRMKDGPSSNYDEFYNMVFDYLKIKTGGNNAI
jgi:hypothetical protein